MKARDMAYSALGYAIVVMWKGWISVITLQEQYIPENGTAPGSGKF